MDEEAEENLAKDEGEETEEKRGQPKQGKWNNSPLAFFICIVAPAIFIT